MENKIKIIIDCDPGHDDAIAILLAAANPMLDIRAITTVAGNAEIEKTSLNALKICEIAGLTDVPVAKGAEKPLIRPLKTAADIHGDSGLDGPRLPEPKKTLTDMHAVDLIIQELKASNGDITLVPTGPLTNIALAMLKEPNVISKIKEIVLMGGALFGNVTPAAEFNIYTDAEAAKIVFESGVPITMVGLELTHQALATKNIIEEIRSIDNKVASLVADLLVFFSGSYHTVFGFEGGPIHDACAVAYCINRNVLTTQKMSVKIETKGEHTYGMTVVDKHKITGGQPNVQMAEKLNKEVFWNMLKDALMFYSYN